MELAAVSKCSYDRWYAARPCRFFTVAPCRSLDTRATGQTFTSNTPAVFTVGSTCGVPANAHCAQSLSANACAQIEFKQAGVWTPATHGVLSFVPDTLFTNFKPMTVTSKTISASGVVSGQLELWGSYDQTPSNHCGPCPGATGGGFQFYKINPDWSLGDTYNIFSTVRCMPAGRAVMRAEVAPLYYHSTLFLTQTPTKPTCAPM
jgi:hypothetical protein